MEDLKDKIIYLQDELIICLKTISNLENDKRMLECLKNSTIESLKKDIEELKAEKFNPKKLQRNYKIEECDECECEDDFIPSTDDSCRIVGKRSIEC